MILSFHPCFTADRQTILGPRHLNAGDLSAIEKADAIILPQHCMVDLYYSCKNSCENVFPDYDARFKYPGKTGQFILFKESGLPCPETIIWHSVEEFRLRSIERGVSPHKTPFLVKSDKGHEAEGVYLVKDEESLESALTRIKRLNKVGACDFLSQELIPSGGNVLRVVIMGSRPISYWKRSADSSDIITTISRGARIDKEWRKDLQVKGRSLARKLGTLTGINLAGIDMVFSFQLPEPEPLLLEINYFFGRRGLGGSLKYYQLLFESIREWLRERGLDPNSVKIV